MEKLKKFATNAKSILTFLIIFVIFYNMILVPILMAFGVPAPVLMIDEATRFLITLGTMGAV